MRLSRCPSTSPILVAVVALAGCPGDDAPAVCGPPDGVGDGIVVASDDASFRFAELTAAANNDCPAPGSPAGLISVTVFGQQVEPAGAAVLTLCLPRPDLLEGGASGVTVPLDPDNHPAEADDRAHVIDVQADLGDGCRWAVDPTVPPTGNARFDGACGDAVDAAGFGLTLDGAVTVIETCPGEAPRARAVTLTGSAAVAAE